MDRFLQRGFDEYLRQKDLKKETFRQSGLVFEIVKKCEARANFSDLSPTAKTRRDVYLFLLMPLVEVAWADGRVTPREMDSILEIADVYELAAYPEMYSQLVNRLLSRPSPKTIGETWNFLHKFWQILPDATRRENLALALLIQARFIAEQSSSNIVNYLRGDNVCDDEIAVVEKIREELKKMQLARTFGEEKTNRTATTNDAGEFEKLLPLVPLVKVAWAEGHITNRERQVIFKAAERFGVKPGTAAYQRLNDWLELHPTDDFYNESLELLSSNLQNLSHEDRTLLKLDLLSDCALIAEASGGGRGFVGGGPRICDEEIAAVKNIAQKLSDRHSAIAA
jgi:uncharacterized tellurite resistance protein B-like protein